MALRCLFNHRCDWDIWNAGLGLGRCRRCDADLVMLSGGHWWALPHDYRIRWTQSGGELVGPHVLPPAAMVALAKRDATALQRLFAAHRQPARRPHRGYAMGREQAQAVHLGRD